MNPIDDYREKETGAVGLVKSPPAFSCENLPLFTATAAILGMIPRNEAKAFFDTCRVSPGFFIRYPGKLDKECSHDDLTGMAVCDPAIAREIYEYGEAHGWIWPGVGYLGRIVDFVPTIKAQAGVPLTYVDQALAASGFLGNLWETKNETNGKCLLFLKAIALQGKYPVINLAISLWRVRMRILYGSMRNVYSIYFGPSHPFSVYGPEDFGESYPKPLA